MRSASPFPPSRLKLGQSTDNIIGDHAVKATTYDEVEVELKESKENENWTREKIKARTEVYT